MPYRQDDQPIRLDGINDEIRRAADDEFSGPIDPPQAAQLRVFKQLGDPGVNAALNPLGCPWTALKKPGMEI